jgi:hypothetical protein
MQFQAKRFQIYATSKSYTNKKKIFERRAEFFRAGMKVQRDEDGGRTLLSDNTGGGEVVL